MRVRQIKEQRDGSKPDVNVNTLNAQEWNGVSQGQKNLVEASQLTLSPVNAEDHDNTQLAQAVDLCGNYGWRDQSVVPNRIELVPYNPKAVISKSYALHDGRYFTFKPNRTNTAEVYVSLSDVNGSPLGNKPLLSKNFKLLTSDAIKQNVDVTVQYLHSVDTNGAFVITAFASVDDDGNLVGGGGEGLTLDHNKLDGLDGGDSATNEFFHVTQNDIDKWNSAGGVLVGVASASMSSGTVTANITIEEDGYYTFFCCLASNTSGSNGGGITTTVQVNNSGGSRIIQNQYLSQGSLVRGRCSGSSAGGNAFAVCLVYKVG